jgi:hypothetical protein
MREITLAAMAKKYRIKKSKIPDTKDPKRCLTFSARNINPKDMINTDRASTPLTISGMVSPGLFLGLLDHWTTVIRNQMNTAINWVRKS